MFLMYVDESGDCGLVNSPSSLFVLTGLVVHELRWAEYKDRLVAFRSRMRTGFGLKLREEIHASALINKPGPLSRIRRDQRLVILHALVRELAGMVDLNVINIIVNKNGKVSQYDVFEKAWSALIQRFENTISHRNFRGPANADECGIILPDHTDDKKLTDLLRKMRAYNPIPNQPQHGMGYRNLRVSRVIEDPNFRNSAHSYFIQACDTIAYMLYQQEVPNSFMRRKSGHNLFRLLDPILCKVASPGDVQGVVRL